MVEVTMKRMCGAPGLCSEGRFRGLGRLSGLDSRVLGLESRV